MTISIDTIISLITLFFGASGLGIFFTWRYARKKAEAEAAKAAAEAKSAEAEAAKANIEANKEMQSLYQRLVDDVKKDREDQRRYIAELKEDRNSLRDERNKMQKRLTQLSDELDNVKRIQARQGRQLEAMRPFLCGDMACKKRQLVQFIEGVAEEIDNDESLDNEA
jgi:chromosome segregation ATPase